MPNKTKTYFSARKRLIVVAIAACFVSAPAWGNPTAPQVVNGSASFTQAGKLLTVTNSNGAIINWNSFSIGAGETTRFNQASAASSVLNRVIANDPSVLLGTLSSNGRVWLVNPAGILVGQGARIDVGGFIGSTLKVRNEDFLAGRLNFGATPNAGKIENHGQISTPSGGSVYLIAPAVENHGIINAPNGEVVLAAGQTVQLVDTGTPGVKVDITGAAGDVTNLGEIVSEAGRIGMAGVLVKNSGVLNASSVVKEGGRVFLKASQDAYVDEGGRIVTTGTKGGSIEVLGNRVAVMDNATLDASGQNGGGQVLVGGDAHGANPDVQNAQVTYFGPGAKIKADAMQQGNGGKVAVWADDTARAYGSISARGGADGGDGGFVETSGKRFLDVAGIKVDTFAAKGAAGNWLLDPTDVTIAAGTGSSTFTGGVFNNGGGASATVYAGDINANLNSNSVTITTSSLGGGSGDITINGTADGAAVVITNNSGGARTFTLLADRDISLHDGATIMGTSASPLSLTMLARRDIALGNSGNNLQGGNLTLMSGWNGDTIAPALTNSNPGGYGGSIFLIGANVPNAGTIDVNAYGGLTISGTPSSGGGFFSTGNMNVSAHDITLAASSGGGVNMSVNGAGTQNVTATNALTLQGAASFSAGHTATIDARNGLQNAIQHISAGQITLTAGVTDVSVNPGGNNAQIVAEGEQRIDVTGSGITLTGGTAGSNNMASIGQYSASGTQTIAVTGGSILLLGGAGTANDWAQIYSNGSGLQSINAKGIVAQGGSVGNNNNASISGHNQSISVGSGGIQIVGGVGGSNNTVSINQNDPSGTQTIAVTSGDVSVSGGTASNWAQIWNNGILQSITLSNSNSLDVVAATGSANINSQGAQTISLTGFGTNAIQVGGVSSAEWSGISANGAQSIVAGTGTQPGAITLQGGTVAGKGVSVGTNNGATTQTISTSGLIRLTGGSATGGTVPCVDEGVCVSIYHNGSGLQSISANGILLQGGPSGNNNTVNINNSNVGSGAQSIAAGTGGIWIFGGTGGPNNSASLGQNNSTGNQTIVVTGGDVSLNGGGSGNWAQIYNQGTTQAITVNDAASVSLVGQAGNANITSSGDQVLLIRGDASANALAVGSASSTGGSFIGGNNQSITVGSTGQSGSINVFGGAGLGQNASISSNSGTQDIKTTGAINLTAGTATQFGSWAQISANGTGLQHLTANSIVLHGANSGTNNGANISANGGQTLDIGSGGLTLTGSVSSGGGNFVNIGQNNAAAQQTINVTNADLVSVIAQVGSAGIFSNGNQTLAVTGTGANLIQIGSATSAERSNISGKSQSITAGVDTQAGAIAIHGGVTSTKGAGIGNNAGNQIVATSGTITLTGGTAPAPSTSGTNCSDAGSCAQIGNNPGSGSQTISAHAISALGGASGGFNQAGIYSFGSGLQTVTINGMGGSIQLQGGSGAGILNSTYIGGGVSSQLIDFTGSGGISLTGGTVGNGNSASIGSQNMLHQIISGGPSITLNGGANGGIVDQANYASIGPGPTGVQNITSGSILLNAGAGGTQNFVAITAPTQMIDVAGTVTINGGGTAANGGARIGGRGAYAGGMESATNLTLTTSGDITLTGGTLSAAAIGSSFSGAAQNNDITINGGGNIVLTSGSGGAARIGAPSGLVLGGDISVSAMGNLSLTGNAANPATIQTSGNVTLRAGFDPALGGVGGATAAGGHLFLQNNVNVNGRTVYGGAAYGSSDGGGILVANSSINSQGDLFLVSRWDGNSTSAGTVNGTTQGGLRITSSTVNSGGALTLLSGENIFLGMSSPNQWSGSTLVSSYGGMTMIADNQIALTGGNVAYGSAPYWGPEVFVSSGGPMNLVANGAASGALGAIVMQAGNANSTSYGSMNGGSIFVTSNGTQTLTAKQIKLYAGTTGHDNSVQLSSYGEQTINITGTGGVLDIRGGIDTTSGGVGMSNNFVELNHGLWFPESQTDVGSGGQAINIASGGTVSLTAGNGTGTNGYFDSNCEAALGSAVCQGGNNGARITNSIGNQSLIFAPGGTLTLTGGNGGNDNRVGIHNKDSGTTQTIAGAPNIAIYGGSAGGAFVSSIDGQMYTLDNSATIESEELQSISAGSIYISGGGAAYGGAGLGASHQSINATGDVTLVGGSAVSSAAGVMASPAFIGSEKAVDIALKAGGSVTAIGNGSGALIGSLLDNGHVQIVAGQDITLTGGTTGGVFIGGFGGASSLPLIVSVVAGRNIAATGNAPGVTIGAMNPLSFATNLSNETSLMAGFDPVLSGGATPTGGQLSLQDNVRVNGGTVYGGATYGGINSGGILVANSSIDTTGDVFLFSRWDGNTTNPGTINGTNLGGLRIQSSTLNAGGALTLVSGNDINLNASNPNQWSGSTLSASATGDALVLATGTHFINSAGASALAAPNGRWLVYSTDPAADNRGGLAYDFKQYNLAYSGTPAAATGNGFIYSIAPSVSASLVGTAAKTYDGDNLAALTAANYATVGAIDGDTVVLSNPNTGTYADRNAGSGKIVSATVALLGASNGSASVYGYQLVDPTASGTMGTITPTALTVNAVTDSRVYNGTTGSSVAPTLTGPLFGDAIGTAAMQSFDTRNAGTGKTLTPSGLVVNDGNGGSNYSINYVPTSSGVITQAPLTVSAQSDTRVYNGTTGSSVAPTLTGTLFGDAIGTAAMQSFDTRNAGTGKTLTASGLVVNDGSGGSNYSISYVPNTTGVITPAPLTVSAQSDTRVYNGTTSSSVAPILTGTLFDAVGTAAIQSFDTRNVGTGKTLTPGGLIVNDGNSGNNYSVNYVPTATGAITQAALTVSAQSDTRVYNGTTSSSVAPTLTGIFSGDTVSTAAIQNFDTRNAGTGKTLTPSGLLVNDGNSGNNYSINYVPTAAGVITQAPLTVSAQSDTRVYDGTTSSSVAPSLTGTLFDTVGTTAIQSFDTRNAGTGKTLTASGLVVNDGNGGGNYAISYVPTATGAITQLASVAWTGGASGNWSQASNWAGGALPDGSNVLAVTIPSGSSVIYDAGTTTANSTLYTLISGGALTLAGGAGSILTVNSQLTTPQLTMTSGSLTGSGNLTVSNSFSQSGGSIGLSGSAIATITQATGDLIIHNLTAQSVSLTAQGGSLSQSGPIVASSLVTKSVTGTNLGDTGNQVSTFTATNSGSGNVVLTNKGALSIAGISNSGGSIAIDNTGAVTTVGAVSAPGGTVTIMAHSPLVIGAGGVSAAGDIRLSAGETADPNDKLTLTGPVSSTASGGSITLFAGDDLVQNANVSTSGGAVSAMAQIGDISMSMGTTTSSSGGGIGYKAPSGNILLTSLDAGSGAIELNAGKNIQTLPGFVGANLIGGNAVIEAGGGAKLSTQVRLLDVNVEGKYSIADMLTGTVMTDAPEPPPAESVQVVDQVVSSVVATTQQQPTDSTTQTMQAPPPPLPAGTSHSSGSSLLSMSTQTIGGTTDSFGGSSSAGGSNASGSGFGSGGGSVSGSGSGAGSSSASGSGSGASSSSASGSGSNAGGGSASASDSASGSGGDKGAADKPSSTKSADEKTASAKKDDTKAEEKKDDKKDEEKKKKDEETPAKKDEGKPAAKKLATCS